MYIDTRAYSSFAKLDFKYSWSGKGGGGAGKNKIYVIWRLNSLRLSFVILSLSLSPAAATFQHLRGTLYMQINVPNAHAAF